MFCPKCKKAKISTIKATENKNNSISRKKYCYKCDLEFESIEKIKSLGTRKPRLSKILMNFRFYVYGNYRVAEAFRTLLTLQKQSGKKIDQYYYSTKKGRVSFVAKEFKSMNGKKMEKVFSKSLEKKIVTIEKILSSKDYWNFKNYIFPKTKLTDDQISTINENFIKHGLKKWRKKAYSEKINDEKILTDMVYKERQQYLKSVAMYISSDEYNQEFFINYKLDKKIDRKLAEEVENNNLWKQQITWNYYTYSR